MARALSAVALAALSLPACDVSFEARTRQGAAPEAGGATIAASSLALDPGAGEPRPRTVRPRGEVVLRFTGPLDELSARRAVRVEDESRGRAPVSVEASVRGRELVLRARDAGGWRPGAALAVHVAGMPSLRALRGVDGSPLSRDARVRVQVWSARRTDRVPPTVVSSDPARGAEDVDPAAPVVVRFSEAMDVRALTFASRGGEEDPPLSLAADDIPMPFRSYLDRERRALTVLPGLPFPPGARVVLSLGERVRDASGNPLDPAAPREVRFTAAPRVAAAGRVVEAFEDSDRMDPLGTTVRWNDPASPGVLEGVLEPHALETGTAAVDGALLLDPRGGTLRTFLPASELGDEARTLKGLLLVPAPGGVPGEVLEPRVRLAPASSLYPAAPETEFAWVDATGPLRGASPRGPDGLLAIPFGHAFPWKGGTGLVVEVSWAGVAGTVILRAGSQNPAGLQEGPRTLLQGVEPAPAALRLSPVMRLDAVGERPAARSRWRDSGAPFPSWQEPRVLPAVAPGACRVEVQGAPPLPDGSGPDLARAGAWTQDPDALEGLRWVRFRVLFEGAEPAVIDELAIPFVGR